MNEKSVVSKYLEYRENVLKYTNIDMNLEIENDEQVYIAVFDIPTESGILYGHTKTLALDNKRAELMKMYIFKSNEYLK